MYDDIPYRFTPRTALLARIEDGWDDQTCGIDVPMARVTCLGWRGDG